MELDQFFSAYDEVPNQRSAQFSDIDVSEVPSGLLFDGLAAVFDDVTDLGEWVEEVRHGAFRKVLAGNPGVPLLHEHNSEQLLAHTQSGRLRLFEDARGLRVSANMAVTDLSQRVKTLVESGDIRGMSWGGIVGRGNSEHQFRDGKPHRVIKNFKKLLDVSTTWDPAYARCEAQFRSLGLAMKDLDDSLPLQQLLSGMYPVQFQERAEEVEPEQETLPSEEEQPPSGVSEAPLLAAKKRRLSLLTLSLEGGELDETG